MKSDELARVRRTLWSAADELRANSTLSPAEYRGPVLGFLAYAEHRFGRSWQQSLCNTNNRTTNDLTFDSDIFDNDGTAADC